jgi:hypothetical protein
VNQNQGIHLLSFKQFTLKNASNGNAIKTLQSSKNYLIISQKLHKIQIYTLKRIKFAQQESGLAIKDINFTLFICVVEVTNLSNFWVLVK